VISRKAERSSAHNSTTVSLLVQRVFKNVPQREGGEKEKHASLPLLHLLILREEERRRGGEEERRRGHTALQFQF
jgi:hypothetical protein